VILQFCIPEASYWESRKLPPDSTLGYVKYAQLLTVEKQVDGGIVGERDHLAMPALINDNLEDTDPAGGAVVGAALQHRLFDLSARLEPRLKLRQSRGNLLKSCHRFLLARFSGRV
jgi:hypothetical protein